MTFGKRYALVSYIAMNNFNFFNKNKSTIKLFWQTSYSYNMSSYCIILSKYSLKTWKILFLKLHALKTMPKSSYKRKHETWKQKGSQEKSTKTQLSSLPTKYRDCCKGSVYAKVKFGIIHSMFDRMKHNQIIKKINFHTLIYSIRYTKPYLPRSNIIFNEIQYK